MILEHDFLMKREHEYKKSKYIYWVKLEQAGGASGGLADGPMGMLAQLINNMFGDAKKDNETILESMKDELIANQKGIDKKLSAGGRGDGGSA